MFGAVACGEPNRPYRAATAMTLGALAKPTGALGTSGALASLSDRLAAVRAGARRAALFALRSGRGRSRRFPTALPRGGRSLKRRRRLLVGPSGQSGTLPVGDGGRLCGVSRRCADRTGIVDAAARGDRRHEPAPRNHASTGRLLRGNYANVPLVPSRGLANGPADRRLESLRARDRRLPSLWVPRRRFVLLRPMGAAYGVRSCGGGL
jgi:hypothetical protein